MLLWLLDELLEEVAGEAGLRGEEIAGVYDCEASRLGAGVIGGS